MAKALNVSLSVTADTSQAKAQLQQLQQSLQQLTANSANLQIGIDPTKLQQATKAATELQAHLQQAINPQNGLLNFSKFNDSILRSGQTIQSYGESLLAAGTQGQKAFSNLASTIARSEVPAKKLSGLFGEFGTVLKNTIRWQASSSLIHGFMGQISTAYNYAKDLNASLNDIRIVTGASTEKMTAFAEKANLAAKSLSTTTNQYTKASLIYYQQGLNDKQVEERTAVTLKLANVTGQSAETVSNQMTAIWNNFAKGGENLEYYADVITALGAATASSSEEISKGLEKFASVADTVGLSYENATAALATITATTRQSADSVGTGLRTLFARFSSLKLGETLEDGVDLTKYTKALSAVGVSVLDTNGELRTMDSILEDLGQRWSNISDTQKTALAQTVGGVRQYTTLMALMNNFDFYKENVNIATTSEGTIQKQQEIYAQSWEAALQRVRAASESIYSDLVNDDFFIDMANHIEGALTALDHFIDGIGGLKGLLSSIGLIATTLFKDQFTMGIYKLGTSIQSLFTPQSVQLQRKENALTWMSEQLVNQDNNYGIIGNLNAQNAKLLRSQIQAESQYATQSSMMTPEERIMATMYLDSQRSARENFAASIESVQAAQNASGDARATLYQKFQPQMIQHPERFIEKLNQATPYGLTTNPALVEAAQKRGFTRDPITGEWAYSNPTIQRNTQFSEQIGKIDKPLEGLYNFRNKILEGAFSEDNFSPNQVLKTLDSSGLKLSDDNKQAILDSLDATAGESFQSRLQKLDSQVKAAAENEINIGAEEMEASGKFTPEEIEQYRQARTKEFDEQYEAEKKRRAAEAAGDKTQSFLDKDAAAGKDVAKTIGKFAQAGMAITSMSSSLDGITNAVTKLGTAGEDGKAALTSLVSGVSSFAMSSAMAFNSLGLVGGIIATVIPLVLKLADSFGLIDKVLNFINPDRVKQQALNTAKQNTAISEGIAAKAKEHSASLDNDLNNYDSLITKLHSLSVGTLEYAQTLDEVNKAQHDLIKDYGLTYSDFDLNGQLNQQKADALKEEAQLEAAQAQMRADLMGNVQRSLESQQAQDRIDANITRRNEIEQQYRDTHADTAEADIQRAENRNVGELTPGQNFMQGLIRFMGFMTLAEQTSVNAPPSVLENTIQNTQEGVASVNPLGQIADLTSAIENDQELIATNNKLSANALQASLISWAANNEISTQESAITETERAAAGYLASDYYKNNNFYSEEEQAELNTWNGTDLTDLSQLQESRLIEMFQEATGQEYDASQFAADLTERKEQLRAQIKAAKEADILAKRLDKVTAEFEDSDGYKALSDYANMSITAIENTQIAENDIRGQDYKDYIQNQIDEQRKSIESTLGEGSSFDFESWLNANKDTTTVQDLINGGATLYSAKKLFANQELTDLIASSIFSSDGFNTEFNNAMSSIRWDNQLRAALDVKQMMAYTGDETAAALGNVYNQMVDAMGGESGMLEQLYGADEFQDSLKKLQKEFKKTGELSAQDIMDVAESCDLLNDYLEAGGQSASALAAAISIMASGGASSIGEISSAFLKAMGTAGALKDQLASVFSNIDSETWSRSVGDISKRFTNVAGDYLSEVKAGRVGGDRMYEEAAALFGDQYAQGLRDFFYNQDNETGGPDISPEQKQKQYDKKYGKYDKLLKKIQKEGNMQPYWEAMLNDPSIGGALKGANGESVSKNLKALGFSDTGKNGDIEIDVGNKTTEEMTAGLASALGISQKEAAMRLQEIIGYDGAAGRNLQKNDLTAAINEMGAQDWENMSWAEQTEFLKQYGNLLKEVDESDITNKDTLDAIKQANKERKKAQKEIADDRLKGVDMKDRYRQEQGKYNQQKEVTDENGQTSTKTDIGETVAAAQDAGYTASEVIGSINEDIQAGNAAVEDFTYTATNAYGEEIPMALETTSEGLIDLEATQKKAEVAIHDSNVAHDAKIQAQQFVDAFKNAEIEPIKLTVDTGDGETAVASLKDAINIEDKEVKINVTDNQTAAAVQALIDAITGKDVDININAIDNVTAAIEQIIQNNSNKTITINTVTEGQGAATGGRVHGSFAAGLSAPNHDLKPGLSLTGEEGPEIVWNKYKGYSYVVGEKHPEFTVLYPGDQVFNAQETKEILNSVALGGKIYESNAYRPTTKDKKGGNSGDKDDKGKDYKPERYHVISRQLQMLEKQYDRLEKAKENAYGTNILDAIEDEIDAQDKLIKKQKELVKEVESYKKKDLKELDKLGVKYKLDENGNIANWDALQKKYEEKAQNGDEKAKKIWEAIQQYEETVDKLEDERDKLQEQIRKKAQLELEKITTKAELKIKFDEKQIKIIEYQLNKITDNIYESADALALVGQHMDRIANSMDTTREAIDSIFKKMVDQNGNPIDMTLDKFLALSTAEQDALLINGDYGRQIEEYIEQLLEYNEELEEFKTTGVERLAQAFEELTDKIEKSMDLFGYYSGILTTMQDIVDLQNIKFPKELRNQVKEINDALISVNENNITAQKDYYQALSQEADNIREKLSRTTDFDLQQKYQEQLDELEDKMRDCMSNLTDLWQAGLQTAQENFERTLNWIIEDYEAAIAGVYGDLDTLSGAYDRAQKVNERYTEDYEKFYQLSKLQRTINKDLDKAALNGYKHNKNMRDLLEEIEQLQASGADLSAYDLELLQKRYEYYKALADLEDARDAKSQVRLQRDRNGNWGYVYTANEENIEDMQQAVDDKLYELQKFIRESSNDVEQQILDLQKTYAEERAELIRNGAAPEVLQEFDDYYNEQLGYLQGEYQKTLDDAGKTVDAANKRYNKDNFDIVDRFEETVAAQVSSAQSTADLINTAIGAMASAADAMDYAVNSYGDTIERLNTLLGGEGDFATNFSEFVASIKEASNVNLGVTEEQIDDFKSTYKEVLNLADEFEQKFFDKFKKIIDKNEKLIESLTNALERLNKIQQRQTGSSGGGNTGGSGGGNTGGSGGGNTGGSGGGGKTGGSGSGSKPISTATHKDITTYGQWSNWISDGAAGHHRERVVLVNGKRTGEKDISKLEKHTYKQVKSGAFYLSKCSKCGYVGGREKIAVADGPSKPSKPSVRSTVTRSTAAASRVLMAYDSGGYTGAWGSNEGRLALLHEKEQVFSKEDTAKLLMASKILQTIDIQAHYASGAYNHLNSPSANNNNQVIEQSVHIEASFPNAVNHAEIEEAFNNLSNKAIQYANRKNK